MKVMIVEDDPMVMKLNVEYLSRIEGMQLVARCSDVTTALVVLEREPIDVVLLDIFLGHRSGLEVIEWLRAQKMDSDVILITAASEMETVRAARQLGVNDYLVKPFEFKRFRDALLLCQHQREALETQGSRVDQQSLDTLFRATSVTPRRADGLPKGLTTHSLVQVSEAILALSKNSFTTEELADNTGMSRVSVRKYLKHLAGRGLLSESFAYGQIGRPSFTYTCLDRDALVQLARLP